MGDVDGIAGGCVATGQSQHADLTELANIASASKSRFDEIYVTVSALFQQQNPVFNVRERDLAIDILRRISKDVGMSIRIALAERLADDATAPHELIVLLADDRIEVARPVLMRSRVLTEPDLIQIARNGSDD